MARVAHAPVSSISPLASPSHSKKAVAMVTRTKKGRVRRKYERGECARERIRTGKGSGRGRALQTEGNTRKREDKDGETWWRREGANEARQDTDGSSPLRSDPAPTAGPSCCVKMRAPRGR